MTQTATVQTFYNPEGRPDSVSRASNPDVNTLGTLVTRTRYDFAGRVVTVIQPDNSADSTVYDPAGNVRWQLSRRQDTLQLTYDALNRLIQRTTSKFVYRSDSASLDGIYPRYPNTANKTLTLWGDTASFSYDAVGNLLTANNRDA